MIPFLVWNSMWGDQIPPTPLQLTNWLLWTIFLMALAVGIVYILLLLWALSRHISHEPLAMDRPLERPARPAAPRSK